jgi:hypothetical protein
MADDEEMEVIEAFPPGSRYGTNGSASAHPVMDVHQALQLFHVLRVYWAEPEREAAVPAHE